MYLVPCQKKLECDQQILNNIKFFFSDVYIRIMIKNGIYCYMNGFLTWNISKKTSYIVGNKCLVKDIFVKKNFCKSFVKKMLTLSQFLCHSMLKYFFHTKNQFLTIRDLSLYISLLVLSAVLVILTNLVVILKLEMRDTSKRITSSYFSTSKLHRNWH